jgi:hypothetical protein
LALKADENTTPVKKLEPAFANSFLETALQLLTLKPVL